jgi:DNA (cytosine-5)-methyltransferase 1
MGTRTRGSKPGSNTEEAFGKLAEVASTRDGLLNRAIAECLLAANVIKGYELEKDLSAGLTRYTDICCNTEKFGVVRLEVMWRTTTGRADIANYTLGKLYNYGRAIGLLE